jgi:hypothetical protein
LLDQLIPAATATSTTTRTTPPISSRRLGPLASPYSITTMRGSRAKAFSLPPSSSVTCMAEWM